MQLFDFYFLKTSLVAPLITHERLDLRRPEQVLGKSAKHFPGRNFHAHGAS